MFPVGEFMNSLRGDTVFPRFSAFLSGSNLVLSERPGYYGYPLNSRVYLAVADFDFWERVCRNFPGQVAPCFLFPW